ncbi:MULTISPECIES: SAM-dependent methyltransferase [Derxia]|uniref:SAM-dependent methyltransferase n=1 Tax=Derxia gummosa DSM 723 TaxID=1121388 RepID=A0A8B6X225_9BURK|nr:MULTISPECIES: SAM-dependent methyltransferase [Derxia]
MTLDQIVPWGRSLREYRSMFSLTDADLAVRILGCADGPASFNAEVTALGGRVVSADPVYRFAADGIRARIAEVAPRVIDELRRNAADYLWDEAGDADALGRLRLAAMDAFLADYDAGRAAGRYVDASLPALPFADGAFDLALCSHFLFLYSAQVDAAAHLAGVRELCRVAREVRIYPLVALDNRPSPHLPAVLAALAAEGLTASVEPVAHRFQKGATEMLRIVRG